MKHARRGDGGAAGVALVTGSDIGIGRAVTERLLELGFHVWATSRHIDRLDGFLAAGAHPVYLDLCDDASIHHVAEALHKEHGALDVLVNNAGYGLLGAAEELDMDAMRAQFEANVFGPLHLTQLLLPAMRERGRGRIVNVGSVAGHIWLPGHGAYHASKHALRALTDTMRHEVAGFGVDVVLVEPGAVRTTWAETALAGLVHAGPYEWLADAVAARIRASHRGLLGRTAASPEAVARVICRAATARRPRRRYRVPLQARAVIGASRWMPDGVWDEFMRRLYPPPEAPAPEPEPEPEPEP